MDRSEVSRLAISKNFSAALVFLSAVAFSAATVCAQETPASEDSAAAAVTGAGDASLELEVPVEPTAARSGPLNESGVFFGHIIYLDPEDRFIFAKPTDPKYPRSNFYLDPSTKISLDDGQQFKNAAPEDLVEGKKIAVRFFSQDRLMVADEVFLVPGEFRPEEYLKARRKKFKAKRGAKAKAPKKAAGGH